MHLAEEDALELFETENDSVLTDDDHLALDADEEGCYEDIEIPEESTFCNLIN